MRKVFYFGFFILFLFFSSNIFGQAGVLDPADADVVFSSTNQPPAPPYGVISKWGHGNRLNWNPYSYGYKSYYFKGMAFRLKFPKTYQHNVVDGKVYPMLIFMHGLGEFAPIYDNELHLLHGGQLHAQAVNNGTYDGFLLYPQSNSGYLQAYFPSIRDLIDSLVKYVKVDIDRITLSGLSSGGQASWDFLGSDAPRWASVMPISAAREDDIPLIPSYLTVPIWMSNGGLDNNPSPGTATDVYNTYKSLGGNITQSFYPLGGHSIWTNFWAEPGYFPALNTAHKANPLVYFQHNQFCSGENIDAKMQVQAGFYAYEWDKDGVTIPGATTNTYNATVYGTYRARFKRTSTSNWSAWSPSPVIVSQKQPTITPPIQIDGLFSNVLPAPDGSTTVPLIVPNIYATYDWRRVSDNSLVSSTNTYTAAVGQYKVQVTEQFGCSSSYSPVFSVITAAGTNVPDKATEVSAIALSNKTIQVYWNNNPTPVNNETFFEVYRSTTAGSNYTLVSKIPADSLEFVDQSLIPNTTYYYIIRAINDNGAAPLSNEASATTKTDTQLPSAPSYLTVTGVSRQSVSLTWNASTDDVGVSKYDVYVNGQKAYSTSFTDFTVNNLDSFTTYTFYVRARDLSGNVSVPSNQVSGFTKFVGIHYKYYEGLWSVLPDFSAIIPVKQGYTANVDISVRDQDASYGFLWEGIIRIPVTGTYKFETGSDDGSKLYIGNYSPTGTALVSNDGVHGVTIAGGSITLTAGLYPIAITYFNQIGSQAMNVYWTCAAAGFSTRTLIPDSYFGDTVTVHNVTLPQVTSNLLAVPIAYNKVHLTWTDNSNNETGFELYRKASSEPDFTMIALLPANTTVYDDTTVVGSTIYSYKLQAVNMFGPSGFNPNDIGGIEYSYYEGSWNNLPDFNSLTPVSRGALPNFSISPAIQQDNFAFKFFGNINIPTAGTYTFYTTSDDGSKLYLNTFDAAGQVVNNDFVQGQTERSGAVTLSAGKHQIWVTYFERSGGQTLQVRWAGPGVTKSLIPDSVFVNKSTTITTPASPSAPAVPLYVTVQVVSPYQINVGFKDSSTQKGYEVYRSVSNANTFHLFKTYNVSDSIISFADTGLYANTKYYYKVRAFGVGGFSGYSAVASATTGNNLPKLAAISSFSMYNQSIKTITLKATDIDGDNLAFSFTNLPSFALFSNTGNGTGKIVFNPSPASNGLYNITIMVNDGKGGQDMVTFTLTVNNNQSPVMYRLRDMTFAEGSVNLTAMTASDPDRNTILKWALTSGPSFLSIRVTSNTTASLYTAPGYGDAGVYPITITVTDGAGGVSTSTANVTITNVETAADDGSVPIAPGNFAAIALSDGTVKLTWKDIAYNESSYTIYRSTNAGGPFTILNSGATNANDSSYIDNTVGGNITYYYKISADNIHGSNGINTPVSVTTVNKIPVLHAISNMVIKSGNPAVLNIVGVDDPGEVLTVTVSGLPSFASYQNTGNGTGNIIFQPQLIDVGTYNNVTVQIQDSYGGTVMSKFSISVIDSSFRSTFINFSSEGGYSVAAPWNNYLYFPFANLALTNLLDASGVNTGYSVKFLEQLTGNFNSGMTNNNKGIYPDTVLLTSVYYSQSSTAHLELAGLNLAKKYNVVIVSSFNSGDDGTATFSVGAQSVTVDAMYNSNKSVQLNGLVPNASGIIDVAFTKGASALNLNINAVVLQEYSGTPLIRPADLFTETMLQSDKIKLTWSDRSNNEAGFEIWRSTSYSGPYVLVSTTAPNITNYTDVGLTPNTKYYYEVRGKLNATTFSAYSNISAKSLPSQIVLLNWDINYPAPSPWNSTNAAPTAGSTFSNLQDNSLNGTGYEMLLVTPFNGEFYAGVNTGGIFPNNVMQSNYWTDASQTSQVKFSNLDHRKKYRIGCFGSATWYGFFNAGYTINGTTLYLNSHNNNSKVIYFEDVTPNSDGEIFLNIAPDAGTPYCFTAAITIEGYDNNGGSSGPIANGGGNNNTNGMQQNIVSETNRPGIGNGVITSIKAFPNPFINDLRVDIELAAKVKKVSLALYDANSRMVYLKVLGSNEVATQHQTLDLSMAKGLPPGNYFLKVVCDGVAQQSIKLVKTR